MLEGRIVADKFLYQVRESDMIRLGGKVLELGSGDNSAVMELFGDKYEVQPSDIYPEHSHIPGVIWLDAMDISSSAVAETQWDAIIAVEVLEHVRYPDRVMSESLKCLSDGGVLIVTTPFFYRIHEYDPHDPTTAEPHVKDFWRFTPRGLKVLFEDAGFSQFWTGGGIGQIICGLRDVIPRGPAEGTWTPTQTLGWGIKMPDEPVSHVADWQIDLPEDWREQQIKMAEDYQERISHVGHLQSFSGHTS